MGTTSGSKPLEAARVAGHEAEHGEPEGEEDDVEHEALSCIGPGRGAGGAGLARGRVKAREGTTVVDVNAA
ncbi:hypothetical protein GCM10011322_35150 [Salinarimonas ramus]|uniref:Uncharacterized protein n=1 Tax=Salinarimonas ramus TaxID=690164 RepID=A0A917QD85_9HYPH|nr:hypothetical protein GCM10011322_35150 [Salinarimonas ramus]